MKKYLATDLDGTLFYPINNNGYVCKENKQALNEIYPNIILTSGRGPAFVKKVCKDLKIPITFIACNGSIIYCDDKMIFCKCIESKTVDNLLNFITNNIKNYYIWVFDKYGRVFTFSDDMVALENRQKIYKENHPKLAYRTTKNISLFRKLLKEGDCFLKFEINLDDESKKIVTEYLNKNNFKIEYATLPNSIEITSTNVNKGTSLVYLSNYLKVDKKCMYVIGDSNNDLPMLELFDKSFLVSNSNNRHLHDKVFKVLNNFKDIKEYLKED